MDNKHTSKASSEGILNNCTEPLQAEVCENDFENILNCIKAENDSFLRDESSDIEYSTSLDYNSIDNNTNKKQQQDEMFELASTSYEKDVHVSDSFLRDESSNIEYSTSLDYNSIDNNKNKKQQQDEMFELASTSYEKDVHVSDSFLRDESSNIEYSTSLDYNSIDNNKNKKQQQDEMFELASTSYEKDVHVSDSFLRDESSNIEYSTSLDYNSSDNNKNKKQQQDEMFELASTSYEKDVNVSESNLQERTDTKLVDDKSVRKLRSCPSTLSPIMKILIPKSKPHICLECCFKCKKYFRLLDSPLHICRIRSIDKQNEFLKIDLSLCIDSCLCEVCWNYLIKTYKSNKFKNRKEESFSEKKYRLLERFWKKNVSKNRNQAMRCSIHSCSRRYYQKMSVNECENIRKIFLTFESCLLVLVESTKQTADILKFPFRLCKIHHAMILVMSTCQICGDKLNAPFNTDDWKMHEMWNLILNENNLPLILKPGMFICVTCKRNISKTNLGFPTVDLPNLRKYILQNNAIRLELYENSPYDRFNLCQGSTYVAFPIVVAKIKEEKECVRSTTIKFSDPLITKTNSEICYSKIDTESIATTALLNVAEQNRCTLEPKDINAMVDPCLIKRKQGKVKCDTTFNKNVKKQRLNKKYSFYENNFTNDITSDCKNKHNPNSDFIVDVPINVDEDVELNTNVPLIHIENILLDSDISDSHDLSDSIILSDSEMFSETDSEEILPDDEIEETDFIIVSSVDDLTLDSDCKFN